MESTPATSADAELVLRLYDFRREAEMRKARNWYVEEFWPLSFSDVEKIMGNFGSPQNRWMRQLASYWEMAASLVVHGALSEALFFDTCGEAWFFYTKLRPYVAQMRASYFPDYLNHLQQLVEGSAQGRERLDQLEAMIGNLRDMVLAARQ